MVWEYTRRQMYAFLFYARRRQHSETKDLIAAHAMAARGDPKQLQKLLKADD